MDDRNKGLDFEQLFPAMSALAALPALQTFRARDGQAMPYRHYPADTDLVLILIHGSSSHSAYLCKFATHISRTNAAQVITPDLRGHGFDPVRRGDIDYFEQLDHDLADLITHLRQSLGDKIRIVLGGHSSGGGFAMRFGASMLGPSISGFLLLAPYLGHNAPTTRSGSGGWVKISLARIVALFFANGFGITRFNGTPVLRFNLPRRYQTGTETLSYSFRLMMGFNPNDYRKELAAIRQPLLVVMGAEDEAFKAKTTEATIKPWAPHADIRMVPGATHLGVVANEEATAVSVDWLRGLAVR